MLVDVAVILGGGRFGFPRILVVLLEEAVVPSRGIVGKNQVVGIVNADRAAALTPCEGAEALFKETEEEEECYGRAGDRYAEDKLLRAVNEFQAVFARLLDVEANERVEGLFVGNAFAVEKNGKALVVGDGRHDHLIFFRRRDRADQMVVCAVVLDVVLRALLDSREGVLKDLLIDVVDAVCCFLHIQGIRVVVDGDLNADARTCVKGTERNDAVGLVAAEAADRGAVGLDRYLTGVLIRRDEEEQLNALALIGGNVYGIGKRSGLIGVFGGVLLVCTDRGCLAVVQCGITSVDRMEDRKIAVLAEDCRNDSVQTLHRVIVLTVGGEIEGIDLFVCTEGKREGVGVQIYRVRIVRLVLGKLDFKDLVQIGHFVLREEILQTEKRVVDRRAAEILRPVGLGGVADVAQEVDGFLVQRGGRAAEAVHVQRHRVVRLSHGGLFHTVEGGVGLLHRLGYRAKGIHIVVVGAVSGVNDVVTELHVAGQTAAVDLETANDGENHGDAFLLLRFSCNGKNDAVCGNAKQGEQNGFDIEQMLLVFHVRREDHLLCNHDEADDCGTDRKDHVRADAADFTECAVCQNEENEAEHEAVAVVQPVRSLEAVPDQIKGTADEAEEEEDDEEARRDFFSLREFLRAEEHRDQHDGDETAVDEGKTLGSDGIVRAGEELGQKIHQLELQRHCPARI